MKHIDVRTLDDTGLQTLIAHHRAKKVTNTPLYLDAIAELERRNAPDLSVEKTIEIICRAASQHKFLSYGDISDAYNAKWDKIRHQLYRHLGDVIQKGRDLGAPVLSAIIVNKQNLGTGDMDPETLEGFCKAARDIGYSFTDNARFLKEQQAAVFDWAKEQTRSP